MQPDFFEQEISVFGLRSKIKDLDPKYWTIECFRSKESFSHEVKGAFTPKLGDGLYFHFNIPDTDICEHTNKLIAENLSHQITKAFKNKFNSKALKDIGEYEKRIYDLEMTLHEYEKSDKAIRLRDYTDRDNAEYNERKLTELTGLLYDNEYLYNRIAYNNAQHKYELTLKKFKEKMLNNVIDFNKVLKRFGITREAV